MSYTIPSVIEQTSRGERVTDVFSRLLSERIIVVGTPLDDGVANVVIAQLLHLAAQQPDADIHLYLNSPGGSYSSMMAMYDTMQFVECEVATICVGEASSTAAVLLAAGAPGKRFVLPHARAVLQQPHTTATRGSMSDLAIEAAELARIRAEAEEILAHHTNRSAEQIRADTDRALVLAGQSAVDYGIADAVLGRASSGAQPDRREAPIQAASN